MVQEGPFVPSLETRPFGTPLRRFKATLQNYVSEKRQDQASNREYMTIQFNFVDLVVMESVEPYPFPIATIGIGYSTTTDTRWDVFASSIKKLFGTTPSLDEIVSKGQEWGYLPCKLTKRLESGEWIKAPDEGWQLVSLDGLDSGSAEQAAQDITERIIEMADGKTDQAFLQDFYQDPEVRKHPDLITAASNRSLLASLEAAGRISRDSNGVWHKAEVPAQPAPPTS